MGGGKSTYSRATDYGQLEAYKLGNIAEGLFNETAPMRSSFENEFKNIQQGGMPYGQTAWPTMLSAARGPIEDQYNVARENVLANVPQGGRLQDELTNVETARAGSLSNIAANYVTDYLNKAYGAAYQTPQTSMAGLGSILNYGTGAMNAAEQGSQARSSFCCFNFLEAEGEIYPTVRKYRDEHYSRDGRVSLGYVRTALILVPLMRKFNWFKQIIRLIMTRPLRAYSKWYYGESKTGFVFYPFKLFWVGSWRLMGVM